MSQLRSGIICTPEEYAASQGKNPPLHCLTRGDSIGLTVTSIAALVSLMALLWVFCVIVKNVVLILRERERRLFNTSMDLLILSLFLADTLQAIGGALNLKWINSGKVAVGDFCNAQGIIRNVGETGVALITLAITVYTFLDQLMRIPSKTITFGVIAAIWLFIAIIVTVGNTIKQNQNPRFEAPTPYWCSISDAYLGWRIGAEYVWLWIALIVSLICYIPLQVFFWMDGNWRRALGMLAYPLVYCVSYLPLSVIRWIGFMQGKQYGVNYTPSAATFTSISIFTLGGFFSVVLLWNTRPDAGLFSPLEVARPPSPDQETANEFRMGRLPD